MKLIKILFLAVIILTMSSFNKRTSDGKTEENYRTTSREFYQIKTYVFKTEQQLEATEK